VDYGRITTELAAHLSAVVGNEHVSTDQETRTRYGQDETEDLCFIPELVIRPRTTGEISSIMETASAHRIPVTPRGGGTGLSGGALPVYGGISLSLERMNSILEIDRANLQAIVQPGVITQTLQEEVEALGFFYPPDPASRGSSHIGGNIAECAGGPRATKYGVTGDYVLGLEAVLADGSTIHTGARVLKNVAGYDLTRLIIGSEGTLAIVTEATLRLVPLPRHRKVILVAFKTLEEASEAVAEIFQHGITPSTLEFMERAAVRIAEERLGKTFPNGQAGAQLFLEVDGNSPESLDHDIAGIAEVLEHHAPLDILLAEDRQKMADVWALRRGIGEAVKSIAPYKEEDTVVPRSRLPELVRGVKEICHRYGIRSICYGHAGDGNVHVNLLNEHLEGPRWQETADQAVREIFALTVGLGGAISGEHGIGYSQKPYLPIGIGPAELRLMREIKKVFDPLGILNPGKIFPDDPPNSSPR
jgi:glycolate oxidase